MKNYCETGLLRRQDDLAPRLRDGTSDHGTPEFFIVVFLSTWDAWAVNICYDLSDVKK